MCPLPAESNPAADPMMSAELSLSDLWRRAWPLEVGQRAEVRVGPLRVFLERHAREWRAAWERDPDPLRPDAALRCPAEAGIPEEAKNVTRFAVNAEATQFSLRPASADRAVVIRPELPLRIPAGAEVDVFASTPLWVAILLHARTSTHELVEIPVSRPSDSWFGANTVEGELAYMSRTTGRLDLQDLPTRHGRAMTTIRVRNLTLDGLTLERVLLPAPELQLFAGADGRIWTQTVEVEMKPSGDADIRYLPGAPIQAPGALAIGQPRKCAHKRLLVRALTAIWS